jgi:hypothetical protein
MSLPKPLRMATYAGVATMCVAACASPLKALEPAEVRAKFSEILVLAAVDPAGTVRALPGVGFVAAMSPNAATAVQQRWSARAGASKRDSELRFQRMSLTDFESAATALRQKDPKLAITYVPDPEQQDIASELLQQQGVAQTEALQRAAREVFAFCPDPLVRITTNPKAGSTSTVVPCGMDFTTIAILVNRSNLTRRSSTVVRAYALPELLAFLTQQSSEDAKNLKILPMPWVMANQAVQAAN